MKVCAFPRWAALPDANLQHQTRILLSIISTMEADGKEGDVPFKTGGSLHSSSSPNGISLPTWGTLVYRSYVFTSFLHCDYAPKAFSSCLCSSSHWHRCCIFPRVHGHWVHGCWIWPCDWLWPIECGQCDSLPVLSQDLKRYCVFLHPALCSTITTRQARPREPGLQTHRADPNPVLRPGARHSWAQIRSSEPCQLLDQWMRTINICYEPSRFGFYLLK